MTNELLRSLPKVDKIFEKLGGFEDFSDNLIMEEIRETIDGLRAKILAGETVDISEERVINLVKYGLAHRYDSIYRRVINASGIVLHTNLGRSCLSKRAIEAVNSACGYMNIEYEVENRRRGSRTDRAKQLICELLGCEDAYVVNNNAAAVLIVLDTLFKGKEVIVSRGELVEIGGSFRIPEICTKSGATLVEVGTTNKTHIWDYENAINENTAALVKVHTSNYFIKGFTEDVKGADLVKLAHKYGIFTYEDLGSGLLYDLSDISDEPLVKDVLDSGIDVVSFSGDKLLGGPQCGIIAGKREFVEKVKRNQLARALRVDKLVLAALEATLLEYFDMEKAAHEIPTIRNILRDSYDMNEVAEYIMSACEAKGLEVSLSTELSPVGGGSLPEVMRESLRVSIRCPKYSANEIESMFRNRRLPIIGLINDDAFVLDMRAIEMNDAKDIVCAINELF